MNSGTSPNPLASNCRELGKLVRHRRTSIGLSLVDAAANMNIETETLARLEDGGPVSAETLFKVLSDLGLAMLVMPKIDAIAALDAVGHSASWCRTAYTAAPAMTPSPSAESALGQCNTPTLFLDFDGSLHAGHALIDAEGEITLDTGRPLFEFAPLLVEMLRPYPNVEVVLTTSWLRALPLDKVIAHLPPELAQRVVGTTKDIKPRFGDLRNGTERTYVIASYAYSKRLRNWLAIDDAVYGSYKFGREPGDLSEHFVLLDPEQGISDEEAQQRIRKWLTMG